MEFGWLSLYSIGKSRFLMDDVFTWPSKYDQNITTYKFMVSGLKVTGFMFINVNYYGFMLNFNDQSFIYSYVCFRYCPL
jgi:hypothetical protein